MPSARLSCPQAFVGDAGKPPKGDALRANRRSLFANKRDQFCFDLLTAALVLPCENGICEPGDLLLNGLGQASVGAGEGVPDSADGSARASYSNGVEGGVTGGRPIRWGRSRAEDRVVRELLDAAYDLLLHIPGVGKQHKADRPVVGDSRVVEDGRRLRRTCQVVAGNEEVDGGDTIRVLARSHRVEVRKDLRSRGLGEENLADGARCHLEIPPQDPGHPVHSGGLSYEPKQFEVVRRSATDACFEVDRGDEHRGNEGALKHADNDPSVSGGGAAAGWPTQPQPVPGEDCHASAVRVSVRSIFGVGHQDLPPVPSRPILEGLGC